MSIISNISLGLISSGYWLQEKTLQFKYIKKQRKIRLQVKNVTIQIHQETKEYKATSKKRYNSNTSRNKGI